ncbi:MAG: hypothetical protein A2958_01300 [Candidatus Levybacteria bacterium RIFCSPLOWO2_01_FULL_38_13]|nr:MAG: hypothetical protein A2629_01160 [Candidatus Levybacteria bacterium RIFCSPHIGHO2_01_FULL_41_15]OGH35790.1 MAG: hypothetical protein A2958_01300 [Candidatus Levybacteria bacterium RIFCSPLOWO2_01_FULL_38_13]
MLNKIAITIGGREIEPPSEVPTGGNISKIIQGGVTLLLLAAIFLALFYMIQAGIQWITSGGDKQRIEQARLRLTYSVVGLIIAFFSFFMINFIFGFFNIRIF